MAKPRTKKIHNTTPKPLRDLKPAYVFIVVTTIAEMILTTLIPVILKHYPMFHPDAYIDARQASTSALNGILQTLWPAEIIGLLGSGIYLIKHHHSYKLGTVYSPNVTAAMGLYGMYFGFYYPASYPGNFNAMTQTVLPYLLRANLYLLGGAVGGWLLGKGLECAGKPGFWIRTSK